MKDTTGELSMTAIVLIGAIALAGIVTFLMPTIQRYINNAWKGIAETCPTGYKYCNGKCIVESATCS